MDGWMDDGCLDGRMDRWMIGWINRQMDYWMEGCEILGEWIDGWMYG